MNASSMHTILLVDDDPDMRQILAEFIKKINLHAVLAAHGKEALERISSEKIDLVISDVQMPVMDGIELIRAIRAAYPHPLPVLLMTGHSDLTEESALSAGASGLIHKPCSIKVLRAKINQLLPSSAHE